MHALVTISSLLLGTCAALSTVALEPARVRLPTLDADRFRHPQDRARTAQLENSAAGAAFSFVTKRLIAPLAEVGVAARAPPCRVHSRTANEVNENHLAQATSHASCRSFRVFSTLRTHSRSTRSARACASRRVSSRRCTRCCSRRARSSISATRRRTPASRRSLSTCARTPSRTRTLWRWAPAARPRSSCTRRCSSS